MARQPAVHFHVDVTVAMTKLNRRLLLTNYESRALESIQKSIQIRNSRIIRFGKLSSALLPMSVTISSGNPLFLVNYATQILCFIIVTPVVFVRIFIRWRITRTPGIDDVSCFLGWAVFMGYCTTALLYGFAGGTKPVAELTLHDFEQCLKLAYVATVLYSPAALFVKTSLIYILIRVFHPIYTGLIALYCLLGMVVCYHIIILFVKIFICTPVSAYWDVSERTNGSCLRQSSTIIADSVISFVANVAIIVSPVALTWSLQMPARKKLRVICILGLGGVAVGFSLFRIVIGVHQRDNRHNTVVFLRAILTGNAELAIGLICACLPALTSLAAHNREQSSPSRQQQKRSQSSSNVFEESELMQRQPRSGPARTGSTVSTGPSAGQ